MGAPIPPRMLTTEMACAYLSVKTMSAVPVRPCKIGSLVRYDLRALDAWLDHLSGLSPSGPKAAEPSPAEDDPDAALTAWMAENGIQSEAAGRA